jgi:crossover junction endodeoxyribonuclease RuvC
MPPKDLKTSRVILGIDPGISRVGYGIIKEEGHIELISSGLLNITLSQKRKNKYHYLKTIAEELEKKLKKYQPAAVAIEKLYVARNSKAALAIAEARGVILYTAARYNVPIFEYAPATVKKAIAGYGKADKKSVARMIQNILQTPQITGPDDVTDALALAITASQELRFWNNPRNG